MVPECRPHVHGQAGKPLRVGEAMLPLLTFAGTLLLAELIQHLFARGGALGTRPAPGWLRTAGYAVLTYLFVFYGASAQSFIYFQF